jgi:mRNA interferase MazF
MPPIRRGEVWWVAFDAALGGEIRKTRPAVVVSNNSANSALNRVVVVPLSSQVAKLYPGEALVMVEGKQAKAMADQITTASKLRLRNRVGALSLEDVRGVEAAILLHLGMPRA